MRTVMDGEPDALEMEAEDGTEILWNEEAEAERVGEPTARRVRRRRGVGAARLDGVHDRSG